MNPKKDIGLLILLVFVDTIYYTFGFVLPYHTSYVKRDHPTYSNALVYSTLIYLEAGLIGINLILPALEKRIGILNIIRLYGLLVMLSAFVFNFFTNIYFVSFGYFLSGITHQISVFCVVFILTVKYKDNLVKYIGIVFAAAPVNSLFWGALTKLLINPDNIGQTLSHMTSEGVVEKYFPPEVYNNFPKFFWIYGLTNLAVAFMLSFLIKVDTSSFEKASQKSKTEIDFPFENYASVQNSIFSREVSYARKMYYRLESLKGGITRSGAVQEYFDVQCADRAHIRVE